VKFNLMMPTRAVKHYDTWVEDGHLADIARLAEAAGFDGVGVTDHPFPDDHWLARGGHHAFDPFVALSFMAAATSEVQLLTFVLVAGYRNPYLAAKSLGSLDKLSGGRVIAGMAAGYLRSEFEALGAAFEGRGRLFDAGLAAMRAAWTGETIDLDGPFPVHGHTQLPAPARPGGPPIWIGGNSEAARRRAAEQGDGWLPFPQAEAMAKITRTPPLQTMDELRGLIADAQQQRVELGKPPLEICFSPFADGRDTRALAAEVKRDLPAYEDAGVTWLTVGPNARSLTAFRDEVALLADELIGA
jgi:probable F420-dependent oxidoreductase